MQSYIQYLVAGVCFRVGGTELSHAVNAIPGFSVFETSQDEVPGFTVTPGREEDIPTQFNIQYNFDTDGVESQFSSWEQGYHLIMTHEDGTRLTLWSVTDTRTVYIHGDLHPQKLRFALWMAYGIMNVGNWRIPFHGSCIVNHGRGYIFLGESGTGKSTHTRLWLKHIEGSHLLNDDSPIIVAEPEGIFIYGSPWSGKTPCYHQKRFPLGACVRLSQAPYNRIDKLPVINAFAALHPSCPPEFAYDKTLYNGISATLDKILGSVPVYHLACLPDEAAAQLSHSTITGKK